MNRVIMIWLLAASIAFAGGTNAPVSEFTPQVLSEYWAAQMDEDGDDKVSREEYVQFATDRLRKIGKSADRQEMLEKFNEFDRNRDGFITAEDPLSPDPITVFLENLKGSWSGENRTRGPARFTFLENGEAEVVRNGLSIGDEAQGSLTYSIVHPGRDPVCIDIAVAAGTSSEWHMKCICKFVEDHTIKLRVFMGDKTKSFPREFMEGHDPNTYVLTRIQEKKKPEPTPESNPKQKSEPGKVTLFGIEVPTGGR